AELQGRLGIAMAQRTYKAYRDLLASDRWLRLLNVGARSQRLLWASTGTKDPKASDVLYVKSLAAPHSVNTMPEKTLLALADHGCALFADDPRRGERLTVEGVGLYLDYSKHRVTEDTLRLLLRLAEEVGLRERIDAMFRGDKINVTEHRAVLHVALRAPRGQTIVVDGEDVVPQVHAVLDRMADFANRLRDGRWTGHTGRRIRNVINIGIGG